jgi:hypothetical protein
MGSTIRFTIFGSENAQSSIHRWRAKAAKRAQDKKAGHIPLAHHLGGIVGLNKRVDEQAHVHDIELPHGGAHHNKDPGHPHPHPHTPHPHYLHPQGNQPTESTNS